MWGKFLEWFIVGFLAKVFPSRYRVIPRIHDGEPLLRQFKITEWAYLQSFVNPEGHDLYHRHRWTQMRSFVLSGEFTEERYPGDIFILHRAPSTYTMDFGTIHRLDSVTPRTWTLFLMRHNSIGWGYYLRPRSYEYQSWDKTVPAKVLHWGGRFERPKPGEAQ